MSPVALAVVVAALALVAWFATERLRLLAELTEVRRQFTDCMELAPFSAYVKDESGRYLYENPKLVESTSQALPDIGSFVGRTDHELFPIAQAQAYVDNDREVLRRGCPLTFTDTSTDFDGVTRQWFSVKFPWVDEHGRRCVAGMSVDITEAMRAQEAAAASEDRCALALEAGHMGSMTLDLTTLHLDTSPMFAVLHGRPATTTRLDVEESIQRVHPDDRPAILAAMQAAREDRAPTRIRYRIVHADGSIAWIELVGKVCKDESGRPTVVRAVGFDITERQTAFEELTRRKAMLRRLIEIQENERQTLCHELHDGMMQYAIGATMLLEAAREEAGSAGLAERIGAAIDCLNRGIAEGRQVIRGVRSAVLDDLGLGAAVEDLADQLATFGIAVELHLDPDLDALPAALRTTVYRVVQESLANVRKHAETDRATVTIRRTPTDVHVLVGDAGVGCDVAEARRLGFGLVGMTERVRLAGGTCTIDSRPGGGTRVEARLPVTHTAIDTRSPAEPPAAYAATPAFVAR